MSDDNNNLNAAQVFVLILVIAIFIPAPFAVSAYLLLLMLEWIGTFIIKVIAGAGKKMNEFWATEGREEARKIELDTLTTASRERVDSIRLRKRQLEGILKGGLSRGARRGRMNDVSGGSGAQVVLEGRLDADG
jgi:hypothetical protein